MFDAKYEPLFVEEKTIKEIERFWEYFVENEDDIINALYHQNRTYMKDFERRLIQVFFRYKKDLRFQFQKVDGTINFTIFYGRSSYLLTVANTLSEYKPKTLKNNWRVKLEK